MSMSCHGQSCRCDGPIVMNGACLEQRIQSFSNTRVFRFTTESSGGWRTRPDLHRLRTFCLQLRWSPKETLYRPHQSKSAQVQHQAKWSGGSGKRQRYMEDCLRYWSQEFLNWLDHCLWRATCSPSRRLNQAKGWFTMSSVQQSLCFRIRTTEPYAVPRQVWPRLVTAQRHRRTRQTSAAAAAVFKLPHYYAYPSYTNYDADIKILLYFNVCACRISDVAQ